MAGPQRKPQPDIYTLLLAIALVAMIICVIMLYMETAKYGQDPTGGVPPVVQVVPSSPLDFDSAVCWMPCSNTNSFFVTNPTGCMDASSTSFLENRLSG